MWIVHIEAASHVWITSVEDTIPGEFKAESHYVRLYLRQIA